MGIKKFVKNIEYVIDKMSLSEKILFYFVSFVFVLSGLMLLIKVNNSFLVEVPSFGGKFTEGVIGSPRFINPVLAISDTDKDLSSLVYSGLLKSDGESFKPDLASSFVVKENGLVYDFMIKDNAYFHDGKKVTADDIIFTISKITDPIIKSPKKAGFDGVSVEKISDNEVQFILSKPYAPFLNSLTVGILPKHIWKDITSEEFPFNQSNIDPIGSGPYKIEKITKNSSGVPTIINLVAFNKYALGQPKIKSIIFKFFQNESALLSAYNNQKIDSIAGLTSTSAMVVLKNGKTIKETSLPRVFGVFFNQNLAPVLANKEVREALNLATPKKKILDEVLAGFGKVINGPVPNEIETDENKVFGNIDAAKTILTKAGWKENKDGVMEKKTKTGTTTLNFTITTSNTAELKKTVEILKEAWQKIGAKTEIKVFESSDLNQNVIKYRKYDALLFGEIINNESDLYPFWHSSERNDPGLNISLYANITVDKNLEEIQKETDADIRANKKEIVLNEIKKDVPAIFLFSPSFIYIPASNIKNISLNNITFQNERFLRVNEWYIETDKVWKIFAPKINP